MYKKTIISTLRLRNFTTATTADLIRQAIISTCGLMLLILLTASAGNAQQFSNPASITIPSVGTATPYPSNIGVTGVSGNVAKATVTLSGFSHSYPGDVGVLLVSPSGASVNLISRCGGTSVSNVNLTFDDAAANTIPSPLTSGTYRPTQCNSSTYAAPAPSAPYGTTLAAVNGSNPNGTWQLFVQDFASGDSGSISGGWRLTITNDVPSPGQLQFASSNFDGSEITGAATITVNRAGGSLGAVTVNYATSNGTATGGASCSTGVDYISTSGTISFADGESSAKTFPVTICDDTLFDPDETVNLTLSNPTGGATLGSLSSATLRIGDAGRGLRLRGPAGSNRFGARVVALPNGNIVVTDPGYGIPGGTAFVSAVYLYNGSNGALISRLTGSTMNDNLGGDGIYVLANGNYVISSSRWDNGAATDAGAVTWCSQTNGCSGTVSSANSLIGSTTDDLVGINLDPIVPLANGNYVVTSELWDNAGVANVGAVTFGNGTTGISGVVSAANSLVGSTANDLIGNGGVMVLPNNNYLVSSSSWNNGAATNAGAVTFGQRHRRRIRCAFRFQFARRLVGKRSRRKRICRNKNFIERKLRRHQRKMGQRSGDGCRSGYFRQRHDRRFGSGFPGYFAGRFDNGRSSRLVPKRCGAVQRKLCRRQSVLEQRQCAGCRSGNIRQRHDGYIRRCFGGKFSDRFDGKRSSRRIILYSRAE